MRTFFQDLRFGFRLLKSEPGFTAVAVLTLALGISVNTTVFSWIDGSLLRPFRGAADGHQLAVFETITEGAPNGGIQMSYVDFCDYRRNLRTIDGIAVHREEVFSLGEPESIQAAWGELVSANYFDVLKMKPELGRFFTPEEDNGRVGGQPVVVISHNLWKRRFKGDPKAVGKRLRVNRAELTVVGVAPPEFRGTMPGLAFEAWIPVTMSRELGLVGDGFFRNRGNRGLYGLVRLKEGVQLEQARAEVSTFARHLAAAFPVSNRGVGATVLPVWEFHSGAPDLLLKPLRILMAISLLLLLIVCANVANLLLARSVARRRELSIRLALGAGGGRLCRQLLTETLLLAAAASVLGLVGAPWMADMLPALVPDISAPIAIGFSLSWRVLAFTIATCVSSALIAGLMPALFWLRSDVNDALKEGGRSGSLGLHSHHARGLLVVSEVALASLALIGAGLFARSFQSAQSIDPGFDRSNVVLARFYMGATRFSTEEMQSFLKRLRERLNSSPSVAAVSYADQAPLGTSAGAYEDVDVPGYARSTPQESMSVNRYMVAPGFFSLLKIPLIEGRDFADLDDTKSAPVMIVNQSFVRRYFAGGTALGRQVRVGKNNVTIVGVVKDSKYFSVAEGGRPHFFVPFLQRADRGRQVFFFVKAADRMAPVMASMRRQVATVDPNASAFDLMPLYEWTQVTLLPQRVMASMASALGLIALVLAAVGLYSVMAYAVTQRTREIGIRMALGAEPRLVLGDVLRRGMTLTVMGLAAGVAASVVVMRLVAPMLIGVSVTDPATFAGATLFLMSIALLASYIPARRATKVDPMSALRCE